MSYHCYYQNLAILQTRVSQELKSYCISLAFGSVHNAYSNGAGSGTKTVPAVWSSAGGGAHVKPIFQLDSEHLDTGWHAILCGNVGAMRRASSCVTNNKFYGLDLYSFLKFLMARFEHFIVVLSSNEHVVGFRLLPKSLYSRRGTKFRTTHVPFSIHGLRSDPVL